MNWLPKREKLDPKQASAIDFAVVQDGNFYVSGEVDSYDSQTCADLERLAVLHLSDDQGALFGRVGVRRRLRHDNNSNEYIC